MKNNKVNRREVDTKTFVAILDNYKIKVSKTEKSSKAFLVDLGVITEKGNLRKNYKNLCIPAGRV